MGCITLGHWAHDKSDIVHSPQQAGVRWLPELALRSVPAYNKGPLQPTFETDLRNLEGRLELIALTQPC